MAYRVPRARRRARAAVALCGALAVAVGGCTASDGEDAAGPGRSTSPSHSSNGPRKVVPPDPGAAFDYQIGGAYPPPAGVRVVSRDRTAKPAPGVYSICYVNAFQAQPDTEDWWRAHHPDLLLRDDDGALVVDQDWDEALLDISTAAKRARLAGIVGRWIDGCAASGFQAVEADNLDSHERSDGLLTVADNVAFGELIAARAHAAGLAIGQKNAAGLARQGNALGFDFAVAEECGQYDECGAYADAYDDRVLVIEYRSDGLAAACAEWGETLSVVLRDLDVVPEGQAGYRRRTC
ncbi:endo alpha-1,4 polygalactosaminidase [Streptomyces ferrugineus]|uniref:Endo alpha-1,4 polygalactosaminidase n=1 Tax=Streptomyces ferrugineus TaxID=1413221 RepID=A0A7M2SS05_9ACTN|nr:endo alpha-1,4 polygalactosaminidase [Streptomyces ferrugineus]QOV39137.1 endo alpha-1,4 polygalactosaminidase [Streptomyces ferrugineus]